MFCTCLFGLCYPLTKLTQTAFAVVPTDIPSQLLLAGMRMGGSGLLILCVGIIRRTHRRPYCREWSGIVLVALFQVVLQYALTYVGQGLSDGAKTPLLKGTSSFIVILLMHFLSKDDKLTWLKTFGCVLGFVGVAFINIDASFALTFGSGETLLLGSAVASAIGYCCTKMYFTAIPAVTAQGLAQTIGGGIMLAVGAISGGRLLAQGSSAWLYLAAIIVVTGIPFLVWTKLYQDNPASLMSVYELSTPLFGTFFTWAMYPESDIFNWRFLLGGLLILAGMFVAGRIKKQGTHTACRGIPDDEKNKSGSE